MNRKLKGVKRVEKELNKFLKQFGLNAVLSTEFYYLPAKNKVAFTFIEAPNDKWFMEFFNSLAPEIECCEFLASLLHEVGHSATYEDFSDEDWDMYYLRCDSLEANGHAASDREINFEYFNLPTERAATEWAIEFMRSHTEEVKVFWHNMTKVIEWFYKINYVEVEEVGC